MMRRKLLMTMGIAIAFASAVVATPPTFKVNAPSWKNLAVATTDGVNIRKSPSATAPKLVYNEAQIEFYDVPLIYYGYWSSTPTKGTIHSIPFEGPEPIVSESNCWYEIKNIGPKMESNGWVNAKFCKTVSLTPMTFSNKNISPCFMWLNTSGNTSDGVYGIYLNMDEMNGVADFYLGRLIDGVVVCPYTLHCDELMVADDLKCGITNNGENFVLRLNPSVMTADYNVNLPKLGGDVLRQIVENATQAPEKVICEYDDGIIVIDN